MDLRRSKRDRVSAGVCGGLAKYFGLNAILLRFVFVVLITNLI
jgi:phage shock protein PspC (stress-responsive transcriptional regulator)